MMERAVTLLPLPDSPTIPIVSPASRENETPSTALTTPSWVLKCVLRLFTSSIATDYSSLSTWPLATRMEGYSSGDVRARVPRFLHVLQNSPVEVAAPLLALLEVLGPDVGAQGIEEIVVLDILTLDVPFPTQHIRYLPANVAVNADDVLWPGLAEVESVEIPDPNQLPYRVGVIIHAQIHDPVVVPAVSAALPHDEQCRRLLSPRVSPCRLSSIQRREQPCGEISLRLCVGSHHRLDRLPTNEDVALG